MQLILILTNTLLSLFSVKLQVSPTAQELSSTLYYCISSVLLLFCFVFLVKGHKEWANPWISNIAQTVQWTKQLLPIKTCYSLSFQTLIISTATVIKGILNEIYVLVIG